MLLWLAALGILVRLFYAVESVDSAFFRVPILDEAFYDTVARALAAGEPVSAINPAFRPLLYPALLSVAYLLGEPLGDAGPLLAVAMQHALGVVTGLLVALLAARLFDRIAAGALAGTFYLLAGPPLFFEGELLITSLFTGLGTILLWVLSGARIDSPAWRWALGGVLVGVMAAARANALVLALALPLAALLLPGSGGRLRRATLASVALTALVTTLFAGAFLQREPLGRFQLMAGGGGVNLYLGNKRGADGMVPRQDRHQSYGDVYRDSVQLFAYSVYLEETGDETQPPDPGAISRFWIGETIDEVRAAPFAWLELMARKAWLLSWNHEIPNNKSFAFIAEHESRLLGWMPVRFWWIFALAGVGLLALWRRPPESPQARDEQLSRLLWLALYVLLLAGAVVLYFVNARYRLPLWPALAVLAGGGALALFESARRLLAPRGAGQGDQQAIRRAVTSACLFAVLASVSLVNWLSIPPITPHRDYFFRSLAYSLKGETEAALRDAEKSVELEARDAAARFQLAAMALEQDRIELAKRHALVAVALEPKEPRTLNQLGVILERQGRLPDAYQAYVRATELGPTFSPAWVNAALLELRANAVSRATRSIERAEKLGDRSVALQCARAFLELKRGRLELGKALLRGAIERDRRVAERLVREYEMPLQLQWGDHARGDRMPPQADPPASPPASPPAASPATGR